MFSQYLHTFNVHHTNYLNDLLTRSINILKTVNKNIQTNNSDDNIDIEYKADADYDVDSDKSHK